MVNVVNRNHSNTNSLNSTSFTAIARTFNQPRSDCSYVGETSANGAKKMFSKLTKLLECPICFNVLTLPVAWCQQNGHTICKNCRKFVNFCPYCKSKWSLTRHLLLEQILCNLLQRCKYCHQVMDVEVLRDHEKRLCSKKKIQCFIFSRGGRCCSTFSKENLLNHLYDRHGRKMWKIFLNETVMVPIKNVFFTKNFCILYEVCKSSGESPNTSFYTLLRLFGDINKKLLCFSMNLIHYGDEEVDGYLYKFYIKRKGAEVHSFEGVCTPTFDIPEPPDRYPGGQPDGRITLPECSPIFTDMYPNRFNFYLRIEKP